MWNPAYFSHQTGCKCVTFKPAWHLTPWDSLSLPLSLFTVHVRHSSQDNFLSLISSHRRIGTDILRDWLKLCLCNVSPGLVGIFFGRYFLGTSFGLDVRLPQHWTKSINHCTQTNWSFLISARLLTPSPTNAYYLNWTIMVFGTDH